MRRSPEKRNPIPGEQRVTFCLAAGRFGTALAQGHLLTLEPKFIEYNFEPLSEESSSTLCCRLATFGWSALRHWGRPVTASKSALYSRYTEPRNPRRR